jgi:hypothetical protein
VELLRCVVYPSFLAGLVLGCFFDFKPKMVKTRGFIWRKMAVFGENRLKGLKRSRIACVSMLFYNRCFSWQEVLSNTSTQTSQTTMTLTTTVAFKATLQKGDRFQIPRPIRWQFKLEPNQVLEVTLNFTGFRGLGDLLCLYD